MKTLMFTAAFAAGLMATSAMGAPVDTIVEEDVETTAVYWYDVVRSNHGLVVRDATLKATGQGDAYDDAMNLVVGGTAYAPTTADLSGTTYTGGTQTIGGANVSMQYMFSADQPIARSLATFTNTSGGELTLNITWRNNSGADSRMAVIGSSSGDNSFGTNDAWVVVNDDEGGDPITGYVLGSSGNPRINASAVSTTTFESFGTEGIEATYSFSLGAGETASLLFFNFLFGDDDGSEEPDCEEECPTLSMLAAEPTPFSMADMLANLTADSDLLADLSGAELARILNFDFGPRQPGQVPAPAALGLFGLGLAGLGALRRKRAA